VAERAAQCPRCRGTFTGLKFCPEHGLPLVQLESTPSREDQTGAIVGGKYRILSRIGEGGMGAVYKVEHVAMGKLMAMKILHRELSAHEQAVLRFEREARAASQLEHPHIILVSDFGIAGDGSFYIVMEHLNGKDLFDVLKDEHIMLAERTVHVMRQVCSGLAEAHRKGVIHRDLKPENIFLATDKEFPDFVKILDFGIAKVLETRPGERTLTAAGTVFGTPEYLSPEQAAGGEIDHRADLYSLGIIMYRMLAGRLPFTGGNKSSLIQRQLSEQPLPFAQRQMPQQVPPSLERVVFRLLAKDPDDRYQDALEVKAALERVDTRPPELAAGDPDTSPPTVWLVFKEDDRPKGMAPRTVSGAGRPQLPPGQAPPLARPAVVREPLAEERSASLLDRPFTLRSLLPLFLALALLTGLVVFLFLQLQE
jgi:serine/threonine-protein kinase